MSTPLSPSADASKTGNGSEHPTPSTSSQDVKPAPLPNGGVLDDGQSSTTLHAGGTVDAITSLSRTADRNELPQGNEPSLERAKSNKRVSGNSRSMGHYPPRRESRQESRFPEQQSHLTESLHELSNHFEESVGKPSREALHKFFYPPGNAASPSPSRRHGKPQMSPQTRKKIKDKLENDDGGADSIRLPLQEQDVPPTGNRNPTTHQTSVEGSSVDPITDPPDARNGDPIPPVSGGFQQSLDAEEEQDRKYVEGFWRTYDDIIMLSLFTQLGVVARLATSTWLTYFDGGVFRSDSPLFTNLPLNCFSCFILGLLGSGDRLMEMVTTRFTPRNLQQGLVEDDSGIEVDGDEDEEAPKEGLRRRKRRSKRAKKKPFHHWEPPLHWHDDLREVQLLALERRIRTSKCLLLFPVAKEDADVMEHYFGEGYQASVQQQRPEGHPKIDKGSQSRSKKTKRRRRFGRQRYAATNLADADDNNFEQSGHDSSRSWSDFHSRNDEESESHDTDSEQQEYEDDGRFRFDLELTEYRRRTPAPSTTLATESAENEKAMSENTTNPLCPISSIPPSVQKLIKRAPGQSNARIMESSGQSTLPPHNSSFRQSTPQAPSIEAPASPSPRSGVEGVQGNFPHTPKQTTETSLSTNYEERRKIRREDSSDRSIQTLSGNEADDPQFEQIISNVQANVSENISRIRRINLADGWDVGTTPEDMADDLMLGLRDGFCGALSSFSSWNSSMLDLLREGQFGAAVVGYMLGIQLPIVAYRFGQQVSVYIFVWRCRREARRDERKGFYGIRVRMDDDDDSGNDDPAENNASAGRASFEGSYEDEPSGARSIESSLEEPSDAQEVPSVRAICTALYLLSLVTQCTSLSFFSEAEDQQIALSLLFSPFGTLARWRLSQFNCWWPGFPLGTFTCNIVACALGGSFGSLLAGNPGPRERILLQSIIAGFGGTLSSLATFVVEILAGIDPLLFRFDGLIYAFCSIAWALIVGFVFEASVDWADETTQGS